MTNWQLGLTYSHTNINLEEYQNDLILVENNHKYISEVINNTKFWFYILGLISYNKLQHKKNFFLVDKILYNVN